MLPEWGCFRFYPIGNTLTVNLALTFKPAFAGSRNVYGYAATADRAQHRLGPLWVHGPFPACSLRRWCPSIRPQGTGSNQTFTFVYSDPLGAADLTSVLALFNNSISAKNACYLQVDLIHNLVLLADDGATTWGSGIPLGSSANLQNSQCSRNGAVSGFVQSGNTLTVNLALTFKPAFAGSRNVYGYAATAAGLNTGWATLGTWTVPGPQVVSVNPSSGTGSNQTFSFVYSDSLGAADLPSVWALFNNTLTFNSACFVQVDLAHNLVLLADDAASTWGSGIPLGSSANLQNSQCSLNGAVSGFVRSGNTLTVNLALTFKPAFAGSRNVYGYAFTAGGLNTGWSTLGTWTAQ